MIGARALISRKTIKDIFWGTTLRRAVSQLFGATAVAQIMGVAASPILTRLYTPESFGIAAVFASILGFLTIVGTLRFEIAIPLTSQTEEARALLRLSLFIAFLFTISIGFLIFIFPSSHSAFRGFQAVSPYSWLVPPLLFFYCAYQCYYQFCLRNGNYSTLARTKLGQSVAGTSTGLALGLASAGPLGLILGSALSNCAGVLSLSHQIPLSLRTSFVETKEIWNKHYKFALVSASAALLNTSGTLLPPILFAAFYSESVTGNFALASRIIGVPMTLMGVALAQVFQGEASRLVRSGNNNLGILFKSLTNKMLLVSVVLLVGGGIAPTLFPLLFGAQWATAGDYAFLLSFPCAAQLMVSPVSMVTFIRRREGVQLALDALRATLIVGSFGTAAFFQLDEYEAVLLFSLTSFLTYAVYYSIYRRLCLYD